MFGTPTTGSVTPWSVVAKDFNGDGILDLAEPARNSNNISFLRGNGDGTFQRARVLTGFGGPTDVASADFNGDGAPDVVVANYESNTVAVLLNKSVTKTTLMATPATAGVGQNVALTATVTSTVAGAPSVHSGNVSFFDGATLLGTAAVDVNGQAGLNFPGLLPGIHSITATFLDDAAFFSPSNSPSANVLVAPETPSGTTAVLTSVTSTTQSGKYNAGDVISVTVSFDQAVTLTGTLTVNLNDGGTATITPFTGTQGTGTYTVAAGQNTQALDSMSLTVSGGTLKDGNGNTVSLVIPTGKSLSNSSNFLIDTTDPTASISAPSAATTTTGPITYTIAYSDTNFATNTLTTADITLNKTGTANGTVTVSGGAGPFKTVTISNITGTLGISLAAGTASDTAGNLAPAAGPSVAVNVTNATSPPTAFAVGGADGTVRLLSATGTLMEMPRLPVTPSSAASRPRSARPIRRA